MSHKIEATAIASPVHALKPVASSRPHGHGRSAPTRAHGRASRPRKSLLITGS
jgi:hypothetical protein